MLTSLKVSGFKNLKDCHVMFGPFTCVAGANGAGKSNLFDVIGLLKDLAQLPLVDAFSKIRNGEGKRSKDLSTAFYKTDDGYSKLEITAEFIVNKKVVDDFQREGTPNSNFLIYKIVIQYNPSTIESNEKITLVSEDLTYVPQGDAAKKLCFEYSKEFFKYIYNNKRTKYISSDKNYIKLHQDNVEGGKGVGRPIQFPAIGATKTVLSTVSSYESPTVLAAKREMQNWMQLQLEPSSLRSYDDFNDLEKLDEFGGHLPATLHRLQNFTEISNTVAKLIPEIKNISVDADSSRRIKMLKVHFSNGKIFNSNNLSDGTLRFLALATLASDKSASSVVCMEEPENGIHPEKIPSVISLLKDIAIDPVSEVDESNPLRQIIINTHSPGVASILNLNELLFAQNFTIANNTYVEYLPIKNTKRFNALTSAYKRSVSDASLKRYLRKNTAEHIIKLNSLEDYVQKQILLGFQ